MPYYRDTVSNESRGMLEHEQMGVIASRASYKLAKTIILNLKQHTFEQHTTWLYRYLNLDPTFKQTKRV